MARKIWLAEELPCAFKFKKNQILSEKFNFYFFGGCKECGNRIDGSFSHFFKNRVVIQIRCRNTTGIKHEKKGLFREKEDYELVRF